MAVQRFARKIVICWGGVRVLLLKKMHDYCVMTAMVRVERVLGVVGAWVFRVGLRVGVMMGIIMRRQGRWSKLTRWASGRTMSCM